MIILFDSLNNWLSYFMYRDISIFIISLVFIMNILMIIIKFFSTPQHYRTKNRINFLMLKSTFFNNLVFSFLKFIKISFFWIIIKIVPFWFYLLLVIYRNRIWGKLWIVISIIIILRLGSASFFPQFFIVIIIIPKLIIFWVLFLLLLLLFLWNWLMLSTFFLL